MANINLLPWREQLREDRKRDFLVSLGIVFAFAAALLLLVDRFYNAEIDDQTQRNNFLNSQIALLDVRLASIRELRAQKALLTERMSVIQDLQGTRPIIVRLFDDLVRTLPDDVYFTSVTRTGEVISLSGIAESNTLISNLMRQLESSEWFTNPVFEESKAAPRVGVSAQDSSRTSFILKVTVTTPDAEQGSE